MPSPAAALRRCLLSLTVAAGMLAACSGLPGVVEPPSVSVAGIGLASPGLFEQELRLDLRVKNPNRFSLDIEGVRFDLALAGAEFAEGFTRAGFELPALGEAIVPVTISVPTNRLIERAMTFGFGQSLDYRLSGEVLLAHRFAPAIPFTREGELALPDIPGLRRPSGT